MGHFNRLVRKELIDVPLFNGLREHGFNLLIERVEHSRVAQGEFVVREGDVSNRFYLLLSGSVRILKHAGTEDETILADMGPGETFGEMCVLETLPRSASVLAIADTQLASLSSMDFHQLFLCYPDEHSVVVTNLARDLSRRLRHLDEVFSARQ